MIPPSDITKRHQADRGFEDWTLTPVEFLDRGGARDEYRLGDRVLP
jgi:hypothetical protein